MRYGIQLFSLRKYLKDEDGYAEVFRRVSEMGAQVVQLSGGKPVGPAFIRKLSEAYSIPVCLTHDNFGRLENDLPALVTEHRIYSCNAMGVGMMPKKFRTGEIADLNKFVDFLNLTADKLAAEGMTIAYHNHWFEFDKVGGEVMYDYLIANTDERVRFIPDTYWMRFAGKSVEEYLDKLAGRVDTLHLKDYKHRIFRAVGKGTLDFKSILAKAKECGVRNAVVELDLSPRPYASMEFSMRRLKEMADAD